MFIVTAAQMQAMDRETIETVGIPGAVLMERAGALTAQVIRQRFGDAAGELPGKRVVVLAGKGNNGGDGFVIARHLKAAGAAVSVFLTTHPGKLTGDARTNATAWSGTGGGIHAASEITDKRLEKDLAAADLVVDALLGTGLEADLRGTVADWVAAVNRVTAPVIAVDLPTGIHADTGQVLGCAVKATLTVTFACPKRGHFCAPGSEHTGALVVADIGIPERQIQEADVPVALTESAMVRARLPDRKPSGHKGSFGHTLIVGGSRGMTGAVTLAALGAQRVGAGLVTVAAPAGLNDILEAKLTEAMTVEAAQTETLSLSAKGLDALLTEAEKRSVTVLGPGLSGHPDSRDLAREFTLRHDGPLVIDADGLNAWAGHMERFPKRPLPTVFTPHPGEMARLAGTSAAEVQHDRIGTATAFARAHDVTVVLKGSHTVIADPYGQAFVNPTGNPALASGGTGDVLAGMIGGLLGQGLSAADAAIVAVFLHGLAADLWVADHGPVGLAATELANTVPRTIQALLDGTAQAGPERVNFTR